MKKKPKLKSCVICGNEFKQFKSTQRVCGLQCSLEYAKQKEKEKAEREWRKEKRQRKIEANPKIRKGYLQQEINKLARMIDEHFNYCCIDCPKLLEYGKPRAVNGAHFHNVGGNENLRFNLHNIHSATMWCNYYNTEHKQGYEKGLIDRYGKDYFNYVSKEMTLEYKYLGLSSLEIEEALKKARKLVREFDEQIKGNLDGSMARAKFNLIIGIYE